MPEFNLDFLYKYFKKTKRYFYSNEINNEAPVVEAFSALQASSDDEEAVYKSGIAFAQTNNFDNYNDFDFHKSNVIVSRIRESTTTDDNKVFYLEYGSWFSTSDPTVVIVNNITNSEVTTTDFLSFPKEGKIIIDDELSDNESVLVTISRDIDFKFGAQFTSYEDDVTVDDIGIMWNNDERGLQATTTTRLPTVSNAYITPTSPSGGNALYANYVLYDRNGNYISGDGLSLGTTINWYKSGSVQSAYKNILRIPGGAVQYGQSWHFVITPHDGVRAGNPVASSTVAVGRGKPIASNVLITPSEPTTTNDLVLTYNYDSPDGTAETTSEIRWYLNDVLQSAYNGRISIFSSETSSNQQWQATIRPYDSINYGNVVKSNIVVIDHSPPTLGNSLAIYPSNPTNVDDLSATYNFSSAEGLTESGPFPNWEEDHPDEDYPEGATITRWYKNDVLQTNLNNHLNVDSSLTSEGNIFRVEVTPGDGVVRGVKAISSNVTIE
jgi:hypothetical protein